MHEKGALPMFRTLLVPLDGSVQAEQALPLASRIARHYGSTVLLLRVINTTNDVRMFPRELSALVPDTTMEPDLLDATAYLAQIATSSDLSGLKLSVGIVSGTAASRILDIAREQQADLIVMCSHGSTGVRRWVMGSVAQKVARYSPIPVLVVREHGYIPSGPYPDCTRPLRPIKALVALDGSKCAEASLVPTVSLLEALTTPARGIMHLIQVVPLPSPGSDSGVSSLAYKEEVKTAETYLRTLVDQLEAALGPDLKVGITWSVIGAHDIAESLICVAEEGEKPAYGGNDLIAMATHGRSGLARWTLGSVTERILGATKLPLLIVRSPDLND
jgi:nucleotide-binding universal stress UspA family protein